MTLAGLRQQAKGIDINDLLTESSDNPAVDRLVGFMTQDQIKQMHTLLDAVSRKIRDQPERATAQRNSELDDDMDVILSGGSGVEQDSPIADEDDEQPTAKRRKTGGGAAAKK
jgi:hypothetical protein